MIQTITDYFRRKKQSTNSGITYTVRGQVKDYDILPHRGGTVLILENQKAEIPVGRYYVPFHIHDIRREHPVGSTIKLILRGDKMHDTANTYTAQLA